MCVDSEITLIHPELHTRFIEKGDFQDQLLHLFSSPYESRYQIVARGGRATFN